MMSSALQETLVRVREGVLGLGSWAWLDWRTVLELRCHGCWVRERGRTVACHLLMHQTCQSMEAKHGSAAVSADTVIETVAWQPARLLLP